MVVSIEFGPDKGAAIKEMVQCTVPGGRVLIGTLNKVAPINRDRLEKGEEPFASANLLGPDELMKLLSRFGEVQMAASAVAEPVQDPSVVAAHDFPAALKLLTGPLLVALVQLKFNRG